MKSHRHSNPVVQAIAENPRASLQDALLLTGAMLIAVVLALEYNLFKFDDQLTARDRQITMAELIFLTGLLAAGIFAFILRRLYEHRTAAARQAYQSFENRRLWERSMRDPLTGLLNRRGLLSALTQASTSTPDKAPHLQTLLLIDIEGVEHINDVYGRSIGDRVLKLVVERFRSVTQKTDTMARLEGSEFVILTQDVDRAAAQTLGERLIGSLDADILVDHNPHKIGIRVGATIFDSVRRTPAEVLNEADLAMRRAKETHQTGPVFYNAQGAS